MTSIQNERRVSRTSRAIALVVVAAFCFHLSRFYLSVELCTHPARNGHALQHCKDVVGWLTAPRAQLGKVSTAEFNTVTPEIRAAVPAPDLPARDISLPPPFHPPKTLG